MSAHVVILSIVVGLFTGLLYGLFFVAFGRRALNSEKSSTKSIIFSSALSSLRMLSLAILFFYLLRLDSINFIILLQSFIVAFWIVIIKKRK